MNSQLPTGTITFLFTDIEGSTPLWEQMPQAMQASVAQHHAILWQVIESNGGRVFQIVGDAFQASFRLAHQGLAAAIAAQRSLQLADWGATGPLKVRMGLHTGSAEIDTTPGPGGQFEYAVGHTLNRAARVMLAGYGGQILLSQETADLVARELPVGIRLKDLGQHRLKGMQVSEHLYQVVAPDLPEQFPPLATGAPFKNNLPTQLSKFIGREKEIAQVKGKLSEHRLVTLTGSGGVGKTRLAIQVGREVLPLYPQGVWLIELAPVANPELVPQAVITTFGLQEDARRAPLMVLADYLREKTALLVLDNCEHVIEACAGLAEYLLRECPDLRVLASSREALGIEGEVAVRVPSLSLPPGDKPTIEALTQSEAAQLFLDRAAMALPGWALTDGNAAAVAQICRRLDGIALAIELAASRVKLLRVEQIAGRLDDAFRLLTGGSRTALPRQQTLRATIDWSYNLLTEAEGTVMRRLAVFAGGGTLEAAEAVCSGDGVQGTDVLDILTQLVNKSLVMADRGQGSEARYYLLETIRQYAREKLNDSGEGPSVRERHARWYAELAERAEPNLHGHGQIEWLDRMEQEHDNLRAVLEWSLHNNLELGLRITCAMIWFWILRGHAVVGLQHIEELLEVGPLDPSCAHAEALAWASWLALFSNHEGRAVVLAETGADMSRETGCRTGLAISILSSAILSHFHGDHDRALPLAEQSLALFEEEGIQWGKRHALGVVGFVAQARADYERAHAIYQEALALSREIGDIDGIGTMLHWLGNLAFEQGRYEQAITFYEEGLLVDRPVKANFTDRSIKQLGNVAIVLGNYSQARTFFEESQVLLREMGDFQRLADSLNRLGRVARLEGKYEQATKFYTDSCKLAWEYGGRQKINWAQMIPRALAGLAELAALSNQPQKAARLLGAAQAIPELYINLWPYERLELEEMANTIRAELDESDFATGYAEGQAMTIDQAVALALSDPNSGKVGG